MQLRLAGDFGDASQGGQATEVFALPVGVREGRVILFRLGTQVSQQAFAVPDPTGVGLYPMFFQGFEDFRNPWRRLQEQIEWTLRVSSLVVGLLVGLMSLVGMIRKMRRR